MPSGNATLGPVAEIGAHADQRTTAATRDRPLCRPGGAVHKAWPGPLRTCLIAGGGTLTDDDGHAADAYGITGEAMALVHPDGYVALTVEAHDTHTVLNYLKAMRVLPPGR
jgi:hypothetical protein